MSVSAAFRASSATASAGQRAGAQRRGQAGDDVFVGHVPVQQQNLDQRAGAVTVAVGLARLVSVARSAGTLNRPWVRERTGFRPPSPRWAMVASIHDFPLNRSHVVDG